MGFDWQLGLGFLFLTQEDYLRYKDFIILVYSATSYMSSLMISLLYYA